MRIIYGVLNSIYSFGSFLGAASHAGCKGGFDIPRIFRHGGLRVVGLRVVGKCDRVVFVVAVGIHNLIIREQEISFLTSLVLRITSYLSINTAGVVDGDFVGITSAPVCVVVVYPAIRKISQVNRVDGVGSQGMIRAPAQG